MPRLPQRQSLVRQTADILREAIHEGTWWERLPAERALCESYQVSRNTLRAALAQLQRERLIQPVHGSGNRILVRPAARPARPGARDVALLAPEPLERLRPTLTLWIDELRAMLNERGFRLHLFHGRQYFRANPGAALRRLTAGNPHGCWVLTLSNADVQRWFAKNDVPCLVAGSVHAGLDLPSFDLDHRAMCRHAAGVLLALGHRRLALILPQSRLAGDLESEAGFVEAVRRSSHPDSGVVIARHDGSVAGISRALRRLLEGGTPPSAILVANAYHYLTVVTRLMQLGRQVPRDVAVISRDDDSFLAYVAPTPARYRAGAHRMARSLLRLILDLLGNEPSSRRVVRLMPEFIRGESIAG